MSYLGKFLLKKRLAKGLLGKELSKNLNCKLSVQFLSSIERGVTSLPINSAREVCRVLEIDREKIIKLMLKDIKVKLDEKF